MRVYGHEIVKILQSDSESVKMPETYRQMLISYEHTAPRKYRRLRDLVEEYSKTAPCKTLYFQ